MSARTGVPRIPLLLLALLTAGCAADGGTPQAAVGEPDEGPDRNRGQAFIQDASADPTILAIAMGSDDHTTLVAAVQAAEMENVLVNAGPLTVFAPTNAAFDALPDGALEDLLRPENQPLLYKVISSHASPSTYALEQLRDGMQLYQASGHHVTVEVRDDGTYVGGAKILGSVKATNGIVHVVDKVFLVALE